MCSVFCMLIAGGLAVLDVVFQTSLGRMPFWCLSLATHGRGSLVLLFPRDLAWACCCVCDLRPRSAGWAVHVIHLCLGPRTQGVLFFLFCGCGLAGTPLHIPQLGVGKMECTVAVPRLQYGVHVDAALAVCVSPPLV